MSALLTSRTIYNLSPQDSEALARVSSKPQSPQRPLAAGLQRYGISRNELHSALINMRRIPDRIRDTGALATYYRILSLDADSFDRQTYEGVFFTGTEEYIVVYSGGSRKQVLEESRQATKLLVVSLRKAQPEYDLPAYALVFVSSYIVPTDSVINHNQ